MFAMRVPEEKKQAVRRLFGTGLTDRAIAEMVGLRKETVNRWRNHGIPVYGPMRGPAVVRDVSHLETWRPDHPGAYSYLLGIYLGDGYVSRHSETSFGLQITLDHHYPEIID